MPKNEPSAKSPKRLNRASGDSFSPLAQDIIRGLEEGIAHMRGERPLPVRRILIPPSIDVSEVRKSTGLSQTQFADHFGFRLRTLQEWEQGRAAPDSAVRAYLCVIRRQPDAVNRALSDRALGE